jgi:hypothetical protein
MFSLLLLSVVVVITTGQLTGDEEAVKADLLAQLKSQDTPGSSLMNDEEEGGGDDEAAAEISITFVNEFPDRVSMSCVIIEYSRRFLFLTIVVCVCRPLTYSG